MKKSALFVAILATSLSFGQNTFPASGNVGIGITNPMAKLDVVGDGHFKVPDDQSGIGGLTIETNNGTHLKMGGNSTYSWIQSHNSKPLYINELGNNTILNLAGGYVGIGTSVPSAKLDVIASASEMVRFGSNYNGNNKKIVFTSGVGGGIINSEDWDSSVARNLSLNANGGNVGIGTANPKTQLHLGTEIPVLSIGAISSYSGASGHAMAAITSTLTPNGILGGSLNFQVNNWQGASKPLTQMTITPNGNVGIGTTTPDLKLTVNGNAKVKENLFISGASGGYTTGDNPILYFGVNSDFAKISVPYADKMILSSYHGYTLNTSNNGSIAIPAVTIGITGNVGIGTTTPDTKLAVNGTIHSKEVKIDLNIAAPDYVFAHDYKLKTLEEIESYILKNNHLPEIPSAKEFKKNGLLVAEMNMNLLKKVEELTLYIIELNKKMEIQQKENMAQSAAIEMLKK